jgi:integrase
MRWTEAGLRALQPTGKREQFTDPTTPGLVLLMTPAGAKTFYLVYRAGGGRAGRKRWHKIGRFGVDGGLEWAQRRAVVLRGRVQEGQDPQETRKAGRGAKPGYTVADLCDRFERDYLDAEKVRPSTAVGYRQHIKAHIRPELGGLTVAEVRPTHITALLESVAKRSPGQANKLRATLSRMFNRAELWELRSAGSNPVRGQDRQPSTPRTVRLSEAQVQRLGAALRDSGEGWQAKAGVVILLLTGMRLSEVKGNAAKKIAPLPWSAVDLEAGVVRLEWHKTAKKVGAKTVYLCPELVAYLKALPKAGPLVLADYRNMHGAWQRLRKAADLPGVTLHDLRHTFTSFGDDLGFSEATRAALVGHKAGTMTGRYTHKVDSALAGAAAKIGGHLWGLLGL